MGTYFHGGSEIQGDGLQTLYLMNPNFVGYSDTQQQQGNMLFLNSAPPHALNPASVPNAPPSQPHHFVGVPLQAAPIGSDDPGRQSMSFHNPIPRFHYNLWSDQNAAGSILPTAAVVGGDSRNTVTGGPTDFATQLGFRRPAVVPTQQQGLSLSLSPQQPAYRSLQAADHDATAGLMSPRSGPGEGFRGSGHSSSSVSAVSNGISGMQSMILGSKYLQAAQELLDEVVNVRNRVNTEEEGSKEKMKKINRESMGVSDEAPSGSKNGTRHGAELTTAERQEIQMKKAKLVSMLDEVNIHVLCVLFDCSKSN